MTVLLHRSNDAFTTLLTGNGLSAAFSLKVRESRKVLGSAPLARAFPNEMSGRKHA